MKKENKIREVIERQRRYISKFGKGNLMLVDGAQQELLKVVVEEIEKAQKQEAAMMEIAKMNDLKIKLKEIIR